MTKYSEKEREAIKKLGLNCFLGMSPIDWWGLSMTKEELIDKLNDEFKELEEVGMPSSGNRAVYVELADTIVRKVVLGESGEKPHTVRYFAVPNDACAFSIGCAAKIYNNGTTYIFANNPKLLETIAEGCYIDIKHTLGK